MKTCYTLLATVLCAAAPGCARADSFASAIIGMATPGLPHVLWPGPAAPSASSGAVDFILLAADAIAIRFEAGADARGSRPAWRIELARHPTAVPAFSYVPAELKAMSLVSRTDTRPGTATYDQAAAQFDASVPAQGTLVYDPVTQSFGPATPLVQAGAPYRAPVRQGTESIVNRQLPAPEPEPGVLAMLGAGVLAMAGAARRLAARRQAPCGHVGEFSSLRAGSGPATPASRQLVDS